MYHLICCQNNCPFKTRKYSCVTARGILPVAYHVHGLCCPGEGREERGVPLSWSCPGGEGSLTWDLTGVVLSFPSPPPPARTRISVPPPTPSLPHPLGKDLVPETGISPSLPQERTWDQRLGYLI